MLVTNREREREIERYNVREGIREWAIQLHTVTQTKWMIGQAMTFSATILS